MSIVNETYKQRKNPKMADKCFEIGRLHIKEFPTIAPGLKKEMGGRLPRVTTFQKLATVLAEKGDFDEAIMICKTALSFGLQDGTKSGFKGRISRLKKKRDKTQST